MHFAILLLFAHAGSSMSDRDLWKAEMDLGEYAEEIGYDSVWVPEHHFDRPYCESPDPLQALTYLAARTSRIQLGTGAIIPPWHHDPIRLAERISILDALSDGRLQLGLGRGLARVEYEGFGGGMDQSRERFNEAARTLHTGLKTGVIEHEGEHFSQVRREIFPRPERSFAERLFMIAMSPESTVAMAEIGGGLMCFNYQCPIEQQAAQFDTWRARSREVQGGEPPPPALLDFPTAMPTPRPRTERCVSTCRGSTRRRSTTTSSTGSTSAGRPTTRRTSPGRTCCASTGARPDSRRSTTCSRKAHPNG